MFWKKTPDAAPLGVALDDLQLLLGPTSIKAKREGNTLIARHEHYTTRVEVLPPDIQDSKAEPIRAVVRVRTELPAPMQELLRSEEMMFDMNKLAALGALTAENGKIYVGSRLTIYEAEDAWKLLQLPLLLFTVIGATEALLGGFRRTMTGEAHRGGASAWTEQNFAQVHRQLSRMCVATSDGLGVTAEFGLEKGAMSAAGGSGKTALYQMMGDQPHPEFGGGIFSLLQMPHQLQDRTQLRKLVAKLNILEMSARDIPPHFGAWCEGSLGNNPAYVTFLPSALHEVDGIALNLAFWAAGRAHWAHAQLAAMGIHV